MQNTEPKISPLPTEEGFRRLVDRLITPEVADVEAKAFIEIVLATANEDDDHAWALANTAARHAFSKTEAFERAFREFAGRPRAGAYSENPAVVQLVEEM